MEKTKKQLNIFVKSDIMCKCNKGLKRNVLEFFFFISHVRLWETVVFSKVV